MRVTTDDVRIWRITKAQTEARRLQTQIDKDNDPRQVKAKQEAKKVAAINALNAQEAHESVAIGMP